MTIDEFAKRFDVTEATVKTWIRDGYLPTHINEDGSTYILTSARKPCTENRAKYPKSKAAAIIKSILKACENRFYICASFYGLCDADFENVMSDLIREEYISSFEADGFVYYNITNKGVEKLHEWTRKIASAMIATLPNIPGYLLTGADMAKTTNVHMVQ